MRTPRRDLKLISSFWTAMREGESETTVVVPSSLPPSLPRRNNLLLPEPFNLLSHRFYFRATGNAFTSRQFSLETPRRFVVGCTCCNVEATRVARELSSGNVVIMRHSVGGHLANCSYARLFSARSARPGPACTARRASPNLPSCAETAIFFFFF